jgi:hypothetical protein
MLQIRMSRCNSSGAVSEPSPPPRVSWLDLAAIGLLAAVAAGGAWYLYAYFSPRQIGSEQWFESDLSRVWAVLTDRYSGYHERARIHPLFSLVNSTLVYGLRRAGRLDAETAVRLWVSASAAALAALVYATARLMRFARADAFVIGALVLASASALFFASVPETKTVSAITLLLAVTAAAVDERHPLPDWALVLVAALSLSMTATNFMGGLALLVVTRPFRRAVQLAVNAFFVVSVLQAAQTFVYWSARGMTDIRSETRFLFDASAGTPLNKLIVSLLHSMVMPVVQTPIEFDTHTPFLSIQRSLPGSSGGLEMVAVALWAAMLIWGARVLWSRRRDTAWKTCGLILAGQIGLHLVYGDQTFLYTLHFLPLLVLMGATVMQSTRPRLGRMLAWALVAAVIASNAHQVIRARQALDRILPLGVHD